VAEFWVNQVNFGLKPAAIKPVATKPAANKSAAIKPAAIKPAAAKPAASKFVNVSDTRGSKRKPRDGAEKKKAPKKK
jgi:hypothetical protein